MNQSTVRRLVGYVLPHWQALIGALAGAVVSVICTLSVPIVIGEAIDYILGEGNVDFAAVRALLLQVALYALGAAVFQWLMLVCTRSISAKAAQSMRQSAFTHITAAPISTIDTRPHGDLVSRLVNDADAVAEGLLQALSQLFPGLVTIVSTVILMLLLNVKIALVVILVTPLSIFFARFVSSRTARYFRVQSRTQGAMGAYVNEMVSNQNTLSAFGFAAQSSDEFEALSADYLDANFKATFYSSVTNPGTRFVNAIVYALVAVMGGILAIGGGISVGSVSVFLSYANQYTKPFNEITSVLTQIQSAIAGAERLFELIDLDPEMPDSPQARSLEHCSGHVQAQNVHFSYDKIRPLIRDFQVDAKPGMHIALVGPTGCGKTTMINLLMRFYEVDRGRIIVDELPITDITRASLRGRYGMVLQDSWLKQASVADNIAYGKPDASREEIVAAAKAAFADSFISRLPQGYDTVLQNDGGNLSEGQRQLLCIARIMLAKPDMLILDEATSSIDTRTEMLIQRALDSLMDGHTSFIVAHRLSTIQNADLILVMKDGKIIEQGTHQQLLAQSGFYAQLYQSQFAQAETHP